MKSKLGVAIAPLIAVLTLAAVACGSTPAASPSPSEPMEVPDQTTTADLTHGLPQLPLSGSPVPSLKFDGVEYVHNGYAELPSGEATAFVVEGTRIEVDDLELVGTTNEGNAAGIQDGLMVYRLRGAGTNEVYTFSPGRDVVNPEDGQVFKGVDAWTRWTAR